MAFHALRRGALRCLSIPSIASASAYTYRDRSDVRCMTPASLGPSCGAKCLFPLHDPRCPSPCDRPRGHFRTHLCACSAHLRDDHEAPRACSPIASFDKVLQAMSTRGFNHEHARTMWQQGFRQAEDISTLPSTHIAKIISPSSSSLAVVPEPSSQSVQLRPDHPVIRPSLRGSRADMFLAIASEEGRKKALDEIEDLTETANSRKTNEILRQGHASNVSQRLQSRACAHDVETRIPTGGGHFHPPQHPHREDYLTILFELSGGSRAEQPERTTTTRPPGYPPLAPRIARRYVPSDRLGGRSEEGT